MPDWKKLVGERMSALNLPPDAKEEVISELAAHLEESYEHARSLGHGEADALQLALREVKDWRTLAAQIHRAQSTGDPMNRRTKTLWMPALASITSASVAMMILQLTGARPQLVWTRHVAISLYWTWLAILPFCGALGAWLSRNAGGSLRARMIAVLMPVLWILGVGILVEPVELAHRGLAHLPYFGYGVGNWVAIPGVALLIGAAPFLPGSAGEDEAAEVKA